MSDSSIIDALMREAQKLARGKSGHSPTPKPGFLQHETGRWRDPALHERIVDAYTRAWEADPGRGNEFALYSRAYENMLVGKLKAAEEDLRTLAGMNSIYAQGAFPVNLHLRLGDRERARASLDALNVENRAKGLPLQKLKDFERLY